MNGEITVESKVGAGSVFEFTLPGRVSDVSEGSKPCCSVFPTEDRRLNGLHVILVDSNLVRQEVSASYLRCLGIHVELAEDVQSTLEILTR
jgi:histidine kinase 2/3/4 (cytokinin receptor)